MTKSHHWDWLVYKHAGAYEHPIKPWSSSTLIPLLGKSLLLQVQLSPRQYFVGEVRYF